MAFLFGKNPQRALDKASGHLDRNDPVRALEQAIDFVNHRDAGYRRRAKEVVERAREALVERGVERSAAAEAEGDYGEAADWLRTAVHHCQDEERLRGFETRLAAMERLAAEPPAERFEVARRTAAGLGLGGDGGSALGGGAPALAAAGEAAADLEDDDDDDDEDGEPSDLYDLLVDGLSDGVAERYRERPPAFRRAYLALNEGDATTALAAFDALAEADPDDPILHFERGRARLLLGNDAGARRDFEAAWPVFGDGDVDAGGSLSVPGLWAEAALALGDSAAVAERLADLADPRGEPHLVELYGAALIAVGRCEEAVDLFRRTRDHHGGRQEIDLGLAAALAGAGRRPQAMRVLEEAIAPSCAGGSCNRARLPLGCVRRLIALQLADAEEREAPPPQRTEELFELLAFGVEGRFGADDLKSMARFHDLLGDAEEATELRTQAAQAARSSP